MSDIKCGSVSIQADASSLVTAGGELGVAFAGPPKYTRGFVAAGGGGLAGGVGGGIAFGMWTGRPKDLDGLSFTIAIGFSCVGGAEVEVNFDKKWRFIGLQVVPQIGFEVELTFSTSYATTF
jgi:hypothetical protein